MHEVYIYQSCGIDLFLAVRENTRSRYTKISVKTIRHMSYRSRKPKMAARIEKVCQIQKILRSWYF